jgi:hypothetical protein
MKINVIKMSIRIVYNAFITCRSLLAAIGIRVSVRSNGEFYIFYNWFSRIKYALLCTSTENKTCYNINTFENN